MEKPDKSKVAYNYIRELYSNCMEDLIPEGVRLMKMIDFKKEEERKKLEENLKKTSLGRELF